MKKILIIGQAPPAIKQSLPYDSTMLYEVLSWVGIDKHRAQELFIFDAVTDKFPGFYKQGHQKPSFIDFTDYLDRGLRERILDAKKILLLGKIAENYIMANDSEFELSFKTILILPHPSRRNYSRIMQQKEKITQMLGDFIKTE